MELGSGVGLQSGQTPCGNGRGRGQFGQCDFGPLPAVGQFAPAGDQRVGAPSMGDRSFRGYARFLRGELRDDHDTRAESGSIASWLTSLRLLLLSIRFYAPGW